MTVFKNTPTWNERLWRVKHLIDIRPISFPGGVEPTLDDVNHSRILPDGQCVIDKRLNIEPVQLQLVDEQKQMTAKYLGQVTQRRWRTYDDVYEDGVGTPPNISVGR